MSNSSQQYTRRGTLAVAGGATVAGLAGASTLLDHDDDGDPSGSVDAEIQWTDSAPSIDAELDAVWDGVTTHKYTHQIRGDRDGPDDISGTWRALWDADTISFFTQISDDTLVSDSPDDEAFKDDTFELFIDGNNDGGSSYDGENDVEYWFRIKEDTPRTGANSLEDTSGIDYEWTDTDTGYQIEVSIPWETLNVTPENGHLMGLDPHVCDDDDGGGRDAKRSWFAPEDNTWKDPSKMGTAKLVGAPDSSDPTGTTSTPGTTSPSTTSSEPESTATSSTPSDSTTASSTDAQSSPANSSRDDETSADGLPGFGVLTAVGSLASVLGYLRLRDGEDSPTENSHSLFDRR